ncbi:MAG: ATP-binding protein [bacterium]
MLTNTDSQDILIKKIKRFLILRVIIATFLLSSIFFLQFKGTSAYPLRHFYIITAVIYLLSIIYSYLYKKTSTWSSSNLIKFIFVQIIFDVLIETLLIFITGGIESFFVFIYILTIISASIALYLRGSLLVTSLISILYGLMANLQYQRVIFIHVPFIPTNEPFKGEYYFYTVFFSLCNFYLVALLSGYLAETLRKEHHKLTIKSKDLIILQKFNINIIKNISSGLIVTDCTGKITLFNKAAEDITGYPKQEVIDRQWDEVFPLIKFKNLAELLIKLDSMSYIFQTDFLSKDNQTLFLSFTCSFLKNDLNQNTGLVISFQDLTELKRMEEQVKRTDKMAAIGELSAGMAHEIRNPLASIRGSVQFLRDELNLVDDSKKLMDIIIKESDRLNLIITEFLNFARPNPLSLQNNIDVNELLSETITLVKKSPIYNNGIRIVLNDASAIKLTGDSDQLKQVFLNLILNGLEALTKRGVIKVTISTTELNTRSYVKINFQDNGTGMTQETLKNIFDPFFTTKKNGTGLGLSVAYRIIEEHGGKIEVSSQIKQGSKFSVLIPMS